MPITSHGAENASLAVGRGGSAALAVTALTMIAALVIAVRDQRQVLYDDAAIAFRFAERLADGRGFTYNDGDRTQGASAPLYTLALASAIRFGFGVAAAASWIGVACYAATVSVVVDLARRIAGTAAAIAASILLLSGSYFRQQMLSGMESPLSALLGVVTLWMVATGRTRWAGAFAGLALVNRLDAVLLVAAVFAAIRWFEGRFPWRFLVVASVVVAPWLGFAFAYFGTPIPFSATQKLAGRAGSDVHDLTWVLRNAGAEGGIIMFGITVLLLAAVIHRPTLVGSAARAATVGAAALWMLGHVALYSLVDLGGSYPWYVTVVYPVEALGAAIGLVLAARGGSAAERSWRLAVLAAATVLVVLRWGGATSAVEVVAHGHTVEEYEGLDLARRDAGRFLGREASPNEVVETCFGWVAFGALEQPIRETCPLATRIEVGEPAWTVVVRSGDGADPPVAGVRRAEFVVDIGAGSTATVYRLDRPPDS